MRLGPKYVGALSSSHIFRLKASIHHMNLSPTDQIFFLTEKKKPAMAILSFKLKVFCVALVFISHHVRGRVMPRQRSDSGMVDH